MLANIFILRLLKSNFDYSHKEALVKTVTNTGDAA